MKPKAQVVYRNLSELHELPGNPRTIKKDQFEKLKKSLTDNADYFEARPIILSDRTGELVIIAGNQRYKAAKAIGLTEVPTILLEGLSEEREREIVIRDNVENGDWDWDTLANEWDAAVLDSWGVKMPVWDENQTEYQQFVDKFKPKLTTDDCYTPPAVFEAVEKWVRKEYKLAELECYKRPKNLKVGTDLVYAAKLGHDWELTTQDCEIVKNTDGLKAMGKGLYGGGVLVSDQVAEKAAAEKAAIIVELSDREKAIVARLNGEAS